MCLADSVRRETGGTIGDARATLGRSQDVCKRARFPVEGERCGVSSWSLFKSLEVNEEEEEKGYVCLADKNVSQVVLPAMSVLNLRTTQIPPASEPLHVSLK